jgi:uncharacterized membrane protein YoaK (UPF0700 family)
MNVSLAAAVLLTWIAGVVDAIGYLLLAHIYTANMSGNSVALGIALGQANWSAAAFRFWPVLIYVAGLLTGRLFLEIGARLGIKRIASAAFLVEAVLLAVATRGIQSYIAIALLAFAMGVQNAALTHFSSISLHTGFVTGTLVKLAENLMKFVTWIWDGGTLREATRQRSLRLSLFLAITWIGYIFGAVAGASSVNFMRANALVLAIAGLVLLMVVDVRRPLAAQDESEQGQVTASRRPSSGSSSRDSR